MNEIARTYKALALAFRRPAPELAAALAPDAELAELIREYTRVFSLTVAGGIAPYELEYGDPGAFSKTQRMADIAGFYRAFGVQLTTEERVDHIGAELEFMHWLVCKEDRGREAGNADQIQICHEALVTFMNDHLGRWAPFFAERLIDAARHPFYETLGESLDNFIETECRRLGVTPDLITAPAPPSGGAVFGCG